MTNDELMQVLNEISDDCYYRRQCNGCKFEKDGECVLKGMPDSWKIKGEEQ